MRHGSWHCQPKGEVCLAHSLKLTVSQADKHGQGHGRGQLTFPWQSAGKDVETEIHFLRYDPLPARPYFLRAHLATEFIRWWIHEWVQCPNQLPSMWYFWERLRTKPQQMSRRLLAFMEGSLMRKYRMLGKKEETEELYEIIIWSRILLAAVTKITKIYST